MGLSGDALAVFLFLLGTAIAAMLAAVNAQPGWRANVSWAICGVFTLSLPVFFFGAPPVPFASFWPVASALTPLVAVALVLLATTGKRAAPGQQPRDQAKPAAVKQAPEAATPPLAAPTFVPASSPQAPSLDSVPATVTAKYLSAIEEGATDASLSAILRPYNGKWIIVTGRVGNVSDRGPEIMMHVLTTERLASSSQISLFFFKSEWSDHVLHLKRDEIITVRAKVRIESGMPLPSFHDAELL